MKLFKNKNFIEILKFIGFSTSAGIIQAISFVLFDTVLKWGWQTSYLLALVLSVLWNFTFNRKFTFKSACNVPIAMIKVAIFYIIFTPASTALGNFLVSLHWHDYLVTYINMLLNMILEYLYDKFIVFKKK